MRRSSSLSIIGRPSTVQSRTRTMIFRIFVALFGLGLTQGIDRQDANQYLDLVLSTAAQDEMRTMQFRDQGIDIPNFKTEFKDTSSWLKAKVKSEYYEGKLSGLSGILRSGDCSNPEFVNGNVSFQCNVVMNNLEATFKIKAKYGKLPSIRLRVTAKIDPIFANLKLTTAPFRNIPYMQYFNVYSYGNVKSDFSGLGPLNKFLDRLQDSFAGGLKYQMYNLLSGPLPDALNRAVAKIAMPLPYG